MGGFLSHSPIFQPMAGTVLMQKLTLAHKITRGAFPWNPGHELGAWPDACAN